MQIVYLSNWMLLNLMYKTLFVINKTNLQMKCTLQEKIINMDYNLQINEFPEDEKIFALFPKE